MNFETFALLAILLAQVYRIIRSETVLRRERAYLEGLTPAGLWPQYEKLKSFYEEAREALAKAEGGDQ
ncbi:MAG TPA: hypothetical protein VJ023_07445 [Pyrinomonadaceae bacterium]|nr:hypothetical protein [Pyrinomonadaceae bacterium]